MAILAGLIGIVVQVLPGAVLVLGGILVWAIMTGGVEAWVVFGVAAVAVAIAEVLQWILAGKHMRKAEVPMLTLAVGGIAGIIGFFVVPVIGLFLFFVAAIFLLEWARRKDVSGSVGRHQGRRPGDAHHHRRAARGLADRCGRLGDRPVHHVTWAAQ